MTTRTLRSFWRFATGLTVVLGLGLNGSGWAAETALDRYVAKPDSNYAFTHYHTQRGVGYTAYFLEMTSQQWRSPHEVDRTLWSHQIALVIPLFGLDSSDTAILLIDGGSNGGALMTEVEPVVGAAAIATGAVIAVVRQIPNQPLYFSDESGRGRKEDEILAYSLDKALDTGDMEWAVHLAMTKAAVRAMDTVQIFAASKGKNIKDFLVLGGSKRGWTTWLTAAVDQRVKAIVPASIDMLNLGQQFIHHWEAYGFFAPALKDYVEFDLPCRVQTPQGKALLQVVDPYSYRNRYTTLPKLILNATGDQFFITDSSRFYYADLPDPKWLRYTPNTDHKQGEDTIINALSWMDDILDHKTSPQIPWTLEENGALRVSPTTPPKQVRLWQATNSSARDFRLEAIGPVWTSQVLQPNADGSYVGIVQAPATGWTAFLIEVTFATAGVIEPDQVYTTGVQITPDTLPYAGTACGGKLENKDAPGSYRNGIWPLDANSNGRWDGCQQDGGQDLCLGFGLAGDTPVAGDWSGTGKTAVGIFRNGSWFLDANRNGRWEGCQQDGGQDLCLGFGLAGDVPVAGDWSGTGKTAVGIFRNGRWFLDANSNGRWDGCQQDGGQDLCLDFGLAGDVPVAGDWSGTGKTAVGIFRNGRWFLDANSNGRWDGCQQDGGQDLCLDFGLAGDMPVAGDWSGTGKTAVGIFRNGRWFLDANSNGRWDG
ncbi:PhoPQ-activated pathogenicity-related family protein, partial [Candidatus Contendibacter odensensis]|uniref:PhoPQ-activated pathogenicity-related family protein n=1 Tax=Candidatus Contendibacter odensensis TaxID=1400860 RepID=UPI000686D702